MSELRAVLMVAGVTVSFAFMANSRVQAAPSAPTATDVTGQVTGQVTTAVTNAKPTQSAGLRPSPGPSEVQDLATSYNETKESLVVTEQEKRKILGSLYNINRRMKRISQEKGHLTDELLKVQGNVKGLAKIIARLEAQIALQRTSLKRRLRVLYKLSGRGYVATLFTQNSAADLDRSLKYLKIITDRDYVMMRSYQENVAEYQAQRTRLKNQVAKLVHIESDIKKREGLLLTEHQAKSRLVSELDASKLSKLSKIEGIRKQTRLLKDHLSTFDKTMLELLKPSFYENRGQLSAPAIGQVVTDFGLIQDDTFPVRFSHKGWQYSAHRGTPVSTVFDGTVAYSGWINGYGHTVIVDHGDHYYTVYARTGKVRVKLGEQVRRNQVIAEAGAASRRFDDGFYFEIRHFSEPENPRNWISRQGVQISAVKSNFTD